MIVFGKYTFVLKNIPQDLAPPQFDLDGGTELQLGLRVFHLFWIPIFPYAKEWILRQDQKYAKVPHDLQPVFDQLYGRSTTPWYSFLGIFLIIGAFFLFKIDSCNKSWKKKKQFQATEQVTQATIMDKINNPSLDDYYVFEGSKNHFFGTKVDSITAEGVFLKYVINNKRVYEISPQEIVPDFILGSKKFTRQFVPSDQLKSAVSRNNGKGKNRPIMLKGLAGNHPISLHQILRITDSENLKFNYSDEEVSSEIEKVFKRFITTTSIDSSLVLLDTASKNYIYEIYSITNTDNEKQMFDFINQSTQKTIDYQMVLYAHYVYHQSNRSNKLESKEDIIRDFGFFLKILDVGLWSIDEKISQSKISNIKMKNKVHAQIHLTSNILSPPKEIMFYIEFNKEEDKWKVNLPSTFSYTKNQISRAIINNNQVDKKYREKILRDLKQIDKGIQVHSYFML
ncbi:MAG: hypothetical protein DWQ02_01090 [Bacteroidetes bacterium]|nr:MAG: hypothetical protein DWQ02_01090 [Bacteroidota bacterium]